eukprot:1519210-Pyramimonas_sp.AAC.1
MDDPASQRTQDTFSRQYKFVMIDALAANVDLNTETFASLGKSSVNFFHVHAAISNREGIALFPKLHAGNEAGSIRSHPGTGTLRTDTYDRVRQRTLAEIFHTLRLDHVDFLKIDAEGYDPFVLFGTGTALSRVKVIQFEYHSLNMWQKISLKTVIEYLSTYEFDCYFDGSPTMTWITFCWSELLEFRKWSNVVCFSEKLLKNFSAVVRENYCTWL